MELEMTDRKRKRMIRVVFIIFMGLLLFFTFFSNTLQSLTLPKVRTENPTGGGLAFTLEGSGNLRPLEEVQLLNPAGWKVQKIHVKAGDRVKKGQKLITYESKSAKRDLDDEITNLDKQKIALQDAEEQLMQSVWEEDELKIRNAERDIETRKLDMNMQERKINELRDNLASQQVISAPFDGVITKLNALEGLASTGEPDVLISKSKLGYQLEISTGAKLLTSLGIAAGEKIEVEVGAIEEQQTRIIDGLIDEMTDAQPLTENSTSGETGLPIPQKILHIKVVDSKLKGGEQARIKLEKHSLHEGLVVSNEAIHHDGDGTFVYKIEEQRSALGNAYVARQIRIQFSETNDKQTMIQSNSLNGDERIILESSEPLEDGNRVRLQ